MTKNKAGDLIKQGKISHKSQRLSKMLRWCLVSLALLAITEAKPLAPGTSNPIILTDTPQAKNLSNSSIPHLGGFSLECNGADYGRNLQYSSCESVVNEQIILTGPEPFAPRGSPGDITYTTPWVYVSSKLSVPPLSAAIVHFASAGMRCRFRTE